MNFDEALNMSGLLGAEAPLLHRTDHSVGGIADASPQGMSKHVAVWLDQREAHVFHINPDRIDEETVRVPQHMHHKHPKLSQGAKEHPDDAKHFFHALSRSLDGAEQILVVGPSTAKLDFVRYVHKNEHTIEPRIIGIETVDHPTNGQLVAYAKQYFGMPVRSTER